MNSMALANLLMLIIYTIFLVCLIADNDDWRE